MASPLEALYQQVILDHARERHGYGLPVLDQEGPGQPGLDQHDPDDAGPAVDSALDRPVAEAEQSGQSRQYNPICGDEVTLRVTVREQDQIRTVSDLSWVGEGCSISQAATSVLHDLVVGHPVQEAIDIVGAYREMLRSRGALEPDEEVLGDAVAFAGVGRHANRVKCAMLGWTAFEDALLRTGSGSGSKGEIR
jgi:nitrogen fixation NifU-like protein